jgi:Cas7 group CRISPR-associated protein Csh2
MKPINRAVCLAVVDCSCCNPNGDPDSDGNPRMTADGRAWVTDVSFKRKLRDIFEDHEAPTFLDLMKKTGNRMNPKMLHVFESLRKGSPAQNPSEAKSWAMDMIRRSEEEFLSYYLDVRLFGTTALEDKKDREKAGGAKIEGELVRLKRTGVVTVAPSVSVAPVNLMLGTITKLASLRESVTDKDSSDMAPNGRKGIQHAVFPFKIAINPHVARQTLTTADDIEMMKAALPYVFSTSESASRPADSLVFRHIWWAEHEDSLGSFDEGEFFRTLTPRKKADPEVASASIEEYDIPTPNFDYKVVDLLAQK